MTAEPLLAPGRYALICHHDSGRIEFTRWSTCQEAEAALAELVPCGPKCIGAHTVVNVDPPPTRPRHPAFSGRP